MAKPQLEEGYTRIARELFCALCLARFSPREWILLNDVFEQVYGPAKIKTAWLYAPDVVERLGLRREHVWHTLGGLVQDGILVRTEDNMYRFVKDYEAWRKGGKPRFNAEGLRYVRATRSRTKGWLLKRSLDRADSGTLARADSGTVSQDDRADSGTEFYEGRADIGTRKYKGTRASETTEGVPSGDSVPTGEKTLPPEHETPDAHAHDRNGEPIHIAPTQSPTEAELQAAGDLAETLFPGMSYDLKARQFARVYPVAWVMEAMTIAAARGQRSWEYICGILRRWKAQGGMDQPVAANAKTSVSTPELSEEERNARFMARIRQIQENRKKGIYGLV